MLFRWQGYRHRGGTDVIYTLIIIWMRVQIGLFRGLGITWTAFLLIFIPSERPGPPDIFKSPAPSWWHTEFYDSKQSSEAVSTDAIQNCAFTLFFSLYSDLIWNVCVCVYASLNGIIFYSVALSNMAPPLKYMKGMLTILVFYIPKASHSSTCALFKEWQPGRKPSKSTTYYSYYRTSNSLRQASVLMWLKISNAWAEKRMDIWLWDHSHVPPMVTPYSL